MESKNQSQFNGDRSRILPPKFINPSMDPKFKSVVVHKLEKCPNERNCYKIVLMVRNRKRFQAAETMAHNIEEVLEYADY